MVPPKLFPNPDTLHSSFRSHDMQRSLVASESYWIASPVDDAKDRISTFGKNLGEHSKEVAQDTRDTSIGLAKDAHNFASQVGHDVNKKTNEISQEASSQASSWFGFFKGKADATSKEANKKLETLSTSAHDAASQLSEEAKNTASLYSQQATDTANKFTEDAKTKASAVSGWFNSVSKDASNTADQYVKDTDAKLNKFSSDIKSTTNQLSQNAADAANETASKASGWFSSFSKNTKDTVDNYSKEANDSLNQATNNAQIAYDQLKTDYNDKYSEYSKQVDQTVNQIDKDLTKGTEKAKGWFSSFSRDTSEKIDQATKNVDNSLNQLTSEAQKAASKISSNAQETVNQYSSQVDDSVKKIDDELNGAARKAKEWLSSISKDASNAASNATDKVSDYKSDAADKASGLLDEVKDNAYGASQAVNQKVTQINHDARQQVANVTQAAESQLNLLTKTIEPHKPLIPLYSSEYFATCAIGGVFACGLTHSAVTPLDLVKCRLQVDPTLYKGNFHAWKTIINTEGAGALFTGLGATFIGYSLQGAGKYGFYEYFKYKYSNIVGKEAADNYRSLIYLSASASAEFIADVLLCPWEAIKVKTQTSIPPYASSVFDGYKKMAATGGFYGGLTPLWLRQIPYTMVKFATFEKTVEAIYSYLPKSKEQYSLVSQTGVSFLGGYIAGIFCAIVSHPADVMVSKVNAEREAGETTGAAVSRIYTRIGFGGLWNGLPVRIVMIGTLTGLQWLLYDSFKAYVGLPTTGGAKK